MSYQRCVLRMINASLGEKSLSVIVPMEQAHPMIKVAWTVVTCLYKVGLIDNISLINGSWFVTLRLDMPHRLARLNSS